MRAFYYVWEKGGPGGEEEGRLWRSRVWPRNEMVGQMCRYQRDWLSSMDAT